VENFALPNVTLISNKIVFYRPIQESNGFVDNVVLCVWSVLSWVLALVFGPCWCFYQVARTKPDAVDYDDLKREMSRDFCCPCYYQG